MRPVVVDSVTDVLAKVLAAGHCTGHPEWDAMPESARTYWRHRATRTRARLQEAGLDINPDQFPSPAPTAPLDVALDVRGFAPPGIDDPLRDFMATYFDREDDYTRGMVIDYLDRIAARHATPDQRHMGSGSLDERANG